MELGVSKSRCKGTRIFAHPQKKMLQNILLMFHCNKWYIFRNIFIIHSCFISAHTGQMAEVFFITFGEISGAGET